MNKNHMLKIAALTTTLLLTSQTSHAREPYYGIKAGIMNVDVAFLTNATNIGAIYGLPMGNKTAFEAEFTTSIVKGDVDFGFIEDEWDVTTLAGYYAYNIGSSPYLKLKGGILFESVSIAGFSESDTGLSLGAGVGWNLNKSSKLELEITIIESDLTFFSIGYLF